MTVLKPNITLRGARPFTVHTGLTLVESEDERVALSVFDVLRDDAQSERADTRASVYWERQIERHDNAQPARTWLAERRLRYPRWNKALEDDLVEALGLTDHIEKPVFMLSMGSARKLNLIGAFAGGADCNCLETPFAALDARSCEIVAELLKEAAAHPTRAWLMFDFSMPDQMSGIHPINCIRLPRDR
ncbi:MAG: hypothetical protein AAF458_21295 [Pseudomonadota bacterium]